LHFNFVLSILVEAGSCMPITSTPLNLYSDPLSDEDKKFIEVHTNQVR